MINSNKILGKPLQLYVDTKTNIQALVQVTEGCQAYTSDTNEIGLFDGTTWKFLNISGNSTSYRL